MLSYKTYFIHFVDSSKGPSLNHVDKEGGRGGPPKNHICPQGGEGGSPKNHVVIHNVNFDIIKNSDFE